MTSDSNIYQQVLAGLDEPSDHWDRPDCDWPGHAPRGDRTDDELALARQRANSAYVMGSIALKQGNPDQARTWFTMACAERHPGAAFRLAVLGLRDIGTTPATARERAVAGILAALCRAAEWGHTDAHHLIDPFITRIGTGTARGVLVRKSVDDIVTLLSALSTEPDECFEPQDPEYYGELSAFLAELQAARQPVAAPVPNWGSQPHDARTASPEGPDTRADANSAYRLGTKALRRDELDAAQAWFAVACDQLHPGAAFRVAVAAVRLAQKGQPVTVVVADADQVKVALDVLRWLDTAARWGHGDARRLLERIRIPDVEGVAAFVLKTAVLSPADAASALSDMSLVLKDEAPLVEREDPEFYPEVHEFLQHLSSARRNVRLDEASHQEGHVGLVFPALGSALLRAMTTRRTTASPSASARPQSLGVEEAADAMRDRGFVPTAPYPGAAVPWPCLCTNCGAEFSLSLSAVLCGMGCRRCRSLERDTVPAHTVARWLRLASACEVHDAAGQLTKTGEQLANKTREQASRHSWLVNAYQGRADLEATEHAVQETRSNLYEELLRLLAVERLEGSTAQSVGAAWRFVELVDAKERRSHSAEPSPLEQSEARPVEVVLADSPRVLLRGAAGTGKSALLQWLAVHAALRTLPSTMEPWSELVPILVRARQLVRMEFPDPAVFMTAEGMPQELQAAGWPDGVFTQGRALVLLDGVDEVVDSDREQVREWLDRITLQYPRSRYVVTTRPSSVPSGWLNGSGFVEAGFTLLDPERSMSVVNVGDAVREAIHGAQKHWTQQHARYLHVPHPIDTQLLFSANEGDNSGQVQEALNQLVLARGILDDLRQELPSSVDGRNLRRTTEAIEALANHLRSRDLTASTALGALVMAQSQVNRMRDVLLELPSERKVALEFLDHLGLANDLLWSAWDLIQRLFADSDDVIRVSAP
ncbi:NACHT domain-containing NTPase (plasmid) [Streptomyces sp. DSM 116496]|uniref:NACHT domain-containing protein n=1 Tax=Streptomyces stoeckheimensis TaxID=3344656 RepID=UPI0038B2DCF6